MFTELEEIGGFFGLWRSYVATPVVVIERLEFAQSDLTEALAWLRGWRTRRGNRARAVDMVVASEPRHEAPARQWIEAFLRDAFVVELARHMPVRITLMNDELDLVERFELQRGVDCDSSGPPGR